MLVLLHSCFSPHCMKVSALQFQVNVSLFMEWELLELYLLNIFLDGWSQLLCYLGDKPLPFCVTRRQFLFSTYKNRNSAYNFYMKTPGLEFSSKESF